MALRVAVTGATGRSGRLVVSKLLSRKNFEAVGIARSIEKAKETFPELTSCTFHAVDVTAESSVSELEKILNSCDALVILTSAVPSVDPEQPGKWLFPEGGTPEIVDWLGQKHQIDAAKLAGVKHVILVGTIGCSTTEEGQSGIRMYKRKSELYLIESGLTYTIINPGGLIDEEGGKREIVFSKKAELRSNARSMLVPRADLAEVVVQSLVHPNAQNKAFDLLAKPPSEAAPTENFTALFATTTPGL